MDILLNAFRTGSSPSISSWQSVILGRQNPSSHISILNAKKKQNQKPSSLLSDEIKVNSSREAKPIKDFGRWSHSQASIVISDLAAVASSAPTEAREREQRSELSVEF